MKTAPNPHKLLIVDDDPSVHRILAKALPPPAYQIQSAFNAQDALETLPRFQPELMILDIMMPHTSGMELLDVIRKMPAQQNLLVLILSAKEAQADRLVGFRHGADDYVAKPFHVTHLVRKIEHMLAKTKPETPLT